MLPWGQAPGAAAGQAASADAAECVDAGALARPATGAYAGVAHQDDKHDDRVPLWRRSADTTEVTQADLDAVPAQETDTPRELRRARKEVSSRLANQVNIPVYVHVIKGKHRGENPGGPRRVAHWLHLLNRGFAGAQNPYQPGSRYRFVLRKISYTKNDGWYHAHLFGPRDKRAKRALHRGGSRALNLYVNGGGTESLPVLGWARYPWQYKRTPRLDGISINQAALPGGRARNYNDGDTLIHEAGHWLGLFHTFNGGCSAINDAVADTPAEYEPSFACDSYADTCPSAGRDPVTNYMDYSYDSCMNHFTAGQVLRMDRSFEYYRQ